MIEYGVLLLNSIVYGDNKRKLYRFVDTSKNTRLFPYKMKDMGFSKNIKNKYLAIKDEQIIDTFGDVDSYEAIYRFEKESNNIKTNKQMQKRCKDLNAPILTSYLDENIFTIDNESTKDFDDALSIKKIDDYIYVSVYISNVPQFLEEHDLFDDIRDISSVYLPNEVINMLPSNLSENILSLKKGTIRRVLCCCFKIQNDTIIDTYFYNVNVRINENYVYDENNLLQNRDYSLLFDTIKNLNDTYELLNDVENSHHVVEFLMLKMNNEAAKTLSQGIFRSCQKGIPIDENLSFLYGSSGQYTTSPEKHEILNLDHYLHITSPIRRIVDIVNMIYLMHELSLFSFNEKSLDFCRKIINTIDDLNSRTKCIKKVQNNISLLNNCLKTDLCSRIHEGYVFDEKIKESVYSYKVFLIDVKLLGKVKSIKQLKGKNKFRIHLMMGENFIKRKVMLENVN